MKPLTLNYLNEYYFNSLFQLSKKNEEATCLLKWLNELIEKRTYLLSGWIDEQIAKNGNNLPFALDEVKASPVVDGYRNKCEFRVGKFQHLLNLFSSLFVI